MDQQINKTTKYKKLKVCYPVMLQYLKNKNVVKFFLSTGVLLVARVSV